MTVANHFVSERNADEVMVVGLNAIREVCARAPLVMNEDLLQDLTQYKSYRNKGELISYEMFSSKSLGCRRCSHGSSLPYSTFQADGSFYVA